MLSKEWSYMNSLGPPPVYLCSRSSLPVGELAATLDGNLTKPVWANLPWSGEFVDIEGNGKPVRQITKVKMCWDEEYFYVGAEIHENQIWGTITTKNATMYHENDFEIFLDPDGSHHNYYEFEMNCLNTIWELKLNQPYKDGNSIVNPYNLAHTKSAVRLKGKINDVLDGQEAMEHDKHDGTYQHGWTIEYAIALAELQEFQNDPTRALTCGSSLRVNFSRVQYQLQVQDHHYMKKPNTKEDNWVWCPTGVIDIHRPEMWGRVVLQQAQTPHVVQIKVWDEILEYDPLVQYRRILNMIYYDQRQFFEENKAYAISVEVLYPFLNKESRTLSGDERTRVELLEVLKDEEKIQIHSINADNFSRLESVVNPAFATKLKVTEAQKPCYVVALHCRSGEKLWMRNDSLFWSS